MKTEEEIKKLAQIIGAGESYDKEVAKYLDRIADRLDKDGKAALKTLQNMNGAETAAWRKILEATRGFGQKAWNSTAKVMKRGLPAFVGLFAVHAATKGWAGQGHNPHLAGAIGAADNTAYWLWGEDIENLARFTLDAAGRSSIVGAPAPGQTRRGLQHGVDPPVEAGLSGTTGPGGAAQPDEVPDPFEHKDYGGFWNWITGKRRRR